MELPCPRRAEGVFRAAPLSQWVRARLGAHRARRPGLGCLSALPARPQGACAGRGGVTGKNKGLPSRERVPLPSAQPAKSPVKQTAANRTQAKEAVRKSRVSHLGSHFPRGRAQGKARRPRWRPDDSLACLWVGAPAPGSSSQNKGGNAPLSRAPRPRSGAGGSSEDRKAPLRQIFSNIRMWREPSLPHPLGELGQETHGLSTRLLFSINGFHCRHELPGSGVGPVPWPEPQTGSPGLIRSLPRCREAPRVLPESSAEEVSSAPRHRTDGGDALLPARPDAALSQGS